MPRPRKWKKVCCLPESNLYGSLDESDHDRDVIIMTVEEYETIRLIDLEDLTQEECAQRMNVARSTVQKLYNEARSKLAKSLVDGNMLKINGGDYKLYEESDKISGCQRCRGFRYGRNFNGEE